MIRTIGGVDLGHGMVTSTFYVDDETQEIYHSGSHSVYPVGNTLESTDSLEEAITIAQLYGYLTKEWTEKEMSEEEAYYHRLGI